jgi:hypothetical protein
MSLADTGMVVETLAEELATIGSRENSRVLLYAEAGPGWMGGFIFFERADTVVYESPATTDIPDLVMELWSAAPDDRKWRGLSIFLDGERFRAELDYGEGWSKDEDDGDRRAPIVRAYFGEKPIRYPPLDGAQVWPPE